jgi:hypothetical protein
MDRIERPQSDPTQGGDDRTHPPSRPPWGRHLLAFQARCRRYKSRIAHGAAALIIMVFTVGLWRAESRVGVTVDEYGHLVRGLAIFWAPDTRLNWPHPPLPHMVVALPTVLTQERVDFTKLPGWDDGDFTKSVKGYWKEVGYTKARAQLVAGRRMMIGFAGAVAAWLWWWTQRRMGKGVAAITLLLWCSHTTLLAHAQLVTNDFAAACCSLFLAASLVDYLRRPSLKRVALLSLACGTSVVTKTSLVAMVAVVLLLVGLSTAIGVGSFRGVPLIRRAVQLTRDTGIIIAFTCLTVCAVYKFDRVFLTAAEYNALSAPSSRYENNLPDTGSSVPIPLPASYIFGIQYVGAQNAAGHTGWFRGQPNPKGDPYYFTTLALVKTPLGLSALAAAGLAGALLRRRRSNLLVPVSLILMTAYFLLASRSKINLGFRHASPTIAWLVLIASRGAADLSRGARLRLARQGFVVACAGASVVAALSVYPLYLGDFNALGGGRKGGLKINLAEEDWGQDIPDLAKVVKKKKLEPLHYFSRFSTMEQELRYFDVKFSELGCGKRAKGWVAVGIKDWTERQHCFGWLPNREPAFVVNDHILVFDALRATR